MKTEYVKVKYVGTNTDTGEHLGFYYHKIKNDRHIYDSFVIIQGKPQRDFTEHEWITNDVEPVYRDGHVIGIRFK